MTKPESNEAPLYYLVIYAETGNPAIESYTSIEEMAERLKTLINEDVTVLPFCGRRLYISEGSMKFLWDDGHSPPIPLFTVPTPDDSTEWSGLARFGNAEAAEDFTLGSPADVISDEEPAVEEEPEE
tara:strand:- start:1814 stop:2194 length:381 start_codon:yes stop_codon:yes gene_type:complete